MMPGITDEPMYTTLNAGVRLYDPMCQRKQHVAASGQTMAFP